MYPLPPLSIGSRYIEREGSHVMYDSSVTWQSSGDHNGGGLSNWFLESVDYRLPYVNLVFIPMCVDVQGKEGRREGSEKGEGGRGKEGREGIGEFSNQGR